jgi:tRNA-2-methylthio-N6-dimethylallyladenosine synthase
MEARRTSIDLTPAAMRRPLKAHIVTFGCQMNEYDSERVRRMLAARGYERAEGESEADLIFVNTCSIRAKAEQKLYSYLGRLKPLKAKNPRLVLAVGGCVAQQRGAELTAAAPHVDLVVGTHGLPRFLELIDRTRRGAPVCYTDFDYDLTPPPPPLDASGLKAHLTIMQGCDNFCAYCVVPYVRGREISRPAEDVLAEARSLVESGVKEINLLGQNVNSYGRGLESPSTFADLLARMARLPGLVRLRFTTSHPKDLSGRLIRVMADHPVVCRHLHLPVQSGSDRILAAMGRKYDRRKYLDLVDQLRAAMPDVALTTDVIVGFPGETDQDFEQTMSLVESVRYDGMFSFKYSDRPMTRAARLSDKVDEAVKGDRLARLQARQKEISRRINREMVGRRFAVLVEGSSGRYPGQLSGRTEGNKIVNFDGPDRWIGRVVRPVIVDAWANSLLGRPDDRESGPE